MSTSISDPSFWILSSLAAGRRHGYGIMQDVTELSEGRTALKVPTLYATLERLERDGLIEAAGDEIVDGRARRYFTISDAGTSTLRDEAARMQAKARIAADRLAARSRPAPTPAALGVVARGSAAFA